MLKAARECGADVRVLDYEERADVAIEGKRWKKVSIAKDVLEEDIKFVWLSSSSIFFSGTPILRIQFLHGIIQVIFT